MESPTWPENRIKAIQELTQGQELTNNLREMLRWSKEFDQGEPKSADGVVGQILEMFDNTLLILGSCSFNGHLKVPKSDLCSDEQESVKTIPVVKHKRRCYKKRKQSWTSSHVTSTLVDDGHAWRKYGQKRINNAHHERSYYRCTYKYDQGCLATKQVQQMGHQPAIYKTTYTGNHICRNLQRAPEIILDSSNPNDTSVLLNFETKELISLSTKHAFMQGVSSQANLRHNQYSSSNNYLSWDSKACVSHDSLEPISIMSSSLNNGDMIPLGVHPAFDHGDMITNSRAYSTIVSTHSCEMDHILEMDDLMDFPFELCV